jgi:ribosome-binding factor A
VFLEFQRAASVVRAAPPSYVGVMMTFRRVSRQDLLSACSGIGPDDGLDPRYDRPAEPRKVPNRKALQLCGQVADTLALVLGECGDDVLRDLRVVSVKPAPTSVRLLVTVARTAGATEEVDQIAGRLEGARGKLRSEIAAAVHRRKAPDLMFRVIDG